MQKYSKIIKSIIKKLPSKKIELKRSFCILLAILITVLSYIGLSTKNSKKSSNDNDTITYIEKENTNEYLKRSKDIIKEYDYNDNYVVTGSINYNVEIALLLEKNNMTYENLIKLIYNTRYKSVFQNLFSKYSNLNLIDFLNIIKGNENDFRDTLYLGDSRTQGMLLSGAISEENTIYGAGYGYKWLTSNGEFSSNKTNAMDGAINGLEYKMQDDKTYNIVIWLGVNDYKSVSSETYFQKFSELAKDRWQNHQIYIVSVGPVDDNRARFVNNEGIDDFNSSLKEKIENSNLGNLNYINLGLSSNLINKYDGEGLHYGASDYQNIHEIITRTIKEDEKKLSSDILALSYNVLMDYDKVLSNQDEMQDIIRSSRQRIK